MIRTLTVCLILTSGGLSWSQEKSTQPEEPRVLMDLCGMWKFSGFLEGQQPPQEGIQKGFQNTDFDDKSWKESRVPLNWFCGLAQGEGGLEGNAFNQTYTEGWYRKKVMISADYQDKRILFRCENASLETWVYVNGKEVGYHYGQYSPFEFDVTEAVRLGEENLFAVRCRIDKLEGRHDNLIRAGICLPVQLRIVPEIYIQRVCINPKVADSKIDIEYSIVNTLSTPKQVTMDGKVDQQSQNLGTVTVKPGTNTFTLSMNLKNPICWSPETPHLYDLVSIVKDGDSVVDERKDRFGFREFIARGPHLYLNGNRYHLFGCGSYGPSGSNFRWGTNPISPQEEKERTKKDFENNKGLGVNFLRAHSAYTPPKYVLEAADEVGMLFYNQWSFVGGKGKLRGEHLQKYLDDMKEYILDAYNNPSLVMFTFTNEIFSSDSREANLLYDKMKAAFPNRLLFTPSSGGSIYTYANKVKTDVIDFHNYTGWPWRCDEPNSKRSWRFMEDTIRENYDEAKRRCGNKPLIVTEFPSWSVAAYWVDQNKSWLPNGKVTPETYIAVMNTPPGLWPISMYDLKNHTLYDRLTRGDGWKQAESLMIKRAAESLRRLDIVQGLEPNCILNNLIPIYKTLYKRVFICAGVFDTNRFSGDTVKWDIYVINDLSEEQKNLKGTLEVINKDGKVVYRNEFNVGSLAGSSRKIIPLEYRIPDTLPTGLYDVKLFLYAQDKLLSDNFYDLYVLNKSALAKIKTSKRILLLSSPDDKGGGQKAKEILDSLGLKYTSILPTASMVDKLRQCDLLVIAPNYNAALRSWDALGKNWNQIGQAIQEWMLRGGRVLSLEQYVSGPLPWAPFWEIYDAGNCWFFDMAVPEHPVYAGMTQRNFDSWNNSQGVSEQSYFIMAMTENVISSVAATSDDRYVMAAAEAKIGKGDIFVSQLNATLRYGKDSAATQYLHNLFSYVLTEPLYPDVRDMKGRQRKKGLTGVDPKTCFCVDLKPYANRGFSDDTPDDGKGGWTDQGENDLRHIPVGKQTFRGIPFEIIDPKTNKDQSCLILQGFHRPSFPQKIEAIAVNRKAAYLVFLHTSAWCPPSGPIAKYVVHFSDGTKSEIDLMANSCIGDWWGPTELPLAEVAWSGKHPLNGQAVGFYVFAWKNPYPDKTILAIDFVSENKVAVPILLAISGYSCSSPPEGKKP